MFLGLGAMVVALLRWLGVIDRVAYRQERREQVIDIPPWINVSEGERQEAINLSEGDRQRRINEAKGRSEEIAWLATASAAAITAMATSSQEPGGALAVKM